MAIPWVTALHLARKLLPVVINKAPELLKTFERFRPASPTADISAVDSDVAALREQIEAHQRTIAAQTETIEQLRSSLTAAHRAANRAWSILAVTVLFSIAIILYLFSRS